ncbi:MAG: hypothetical protein JNG88_12525 [Phycisphaerales bacterium]|nr:hypothetical protein [Phycisphaerales bacterium]
MGKLIRGDAHNSPQFAFADFESMAGAARQRANAQALEILRSADIKARRDAEEARCKALQAGQVEGRKLGMESIRREAWEAVLSESRARMAQLTDALQSALIQVDAGKRRMLAESESGVIRLAIEIARRICKHVALGSPDAAISNAEKLIELIRHHHDAQLRLNPDDLAEIRKIAPAWLNQLEHQQHVCVIADEAVERGGSTLSSAGGYIDAGIETQIERITAALLGEAVAAENDADSGPSASRFVAVDSGDETVPQPECAVRA